MAYHDRVRVKDPRFGDDGRDTLGEPTKLFDEDRASKQRPHKPMLASGASVGHFEVIRRVGRGGMGEVYLAQDLTLGRKVALKVIRPDAVGSPEALAQFMAEARVTARLNHPHIVTIYHAGEIDVDDQPAPYLALEYLEGDTLWTRMKERMLSIAETLRVTAVIAAALGEAHRHGVLHRDLKPENVIIPPDGRPRLIDFGLATVMSHHVDPWERDLVTHSGQKRGGTPVYMAPEQWRGEESTEATDVWALGVLIFELCSGRVPYVDGGDQLVDRVCSSDPAPRLSEVVDVPKEVDELVARCLRKDPQGRPSAAEVEEALRGCGRERRSGAERRSPYRGLLAFTQHDADFYFGRDREVDAFVERVRAYPVLPVVGPSGAGKSSFVRAGVIPRLREQEPWLVMVVRPGARPFESLANQLVWRESIFVTGVVDSLPPSARRSGPESVPASIPPLSSPASVPPNSQPPASLPPLSLPPAPRSSSSGLGSASSPGRGAGRVEELAQALRDEPRQLALTLRTLSEEHGSKVLLVVDQLEELFTMTEDADLRRSFMEAICTGADHPLDPVRVVFTVRDDFLGRIAVGPDVWVASRSGRTSRRRFRRSRSSSGSATMRFARPSPGRSRPWAIVSMTSPCRARWWPRCVESRARSPCCSFVRACSGNGAMRKTGSSEGTTTRPSAGWRGRWPDTPTKCSKA
jgi:serine/threonine protein kinase